MTCYTAAMRHLLAASLLALAACGQPTQSPDASTADAPTDAPPDAACSLVCSAVQTCCDVPGVGQRCIDYISDPENCGACGRRCLFDGICVNRECVTP